MINGSIFWVLLIWIDGGNSGRMLPPSVVPMVSEAACEAARTQLDKDTPFSYRFTACVSTR